MPIGDLDGFEPSTVANSAAPARSQARAPDTASGLADIEYWNALDLMATGARDQPCLTLTKESPATIPQGMSPKACESPGPPRHKDVR